MMKTVALIFVAVLAVVALAASPGKAISCGDAINSISPCREYLTGGSGSASQACCSGVKGLAGSAQSPQDKQTVCNCLKSAASGVSGLNYGAVSSLPGQCGVSVSYSISPNIDCSQVS